MTENNDIINAISDLINPPFRRITREQTSLYLERPISTVDKWSKTGKKINGRTVKLEKEGGLILFASVINFKKALINTE